MTDPDSRWKQRFRNFDFMFGLTKNDIEIIVKLLSKYEEIDKAVVFGSRAKVTYKSGSDLDIALFGKLLSFQTISKLSYEFNEESLMPYHFDILNYNTIQNEELKNHIKKFGKVIYTRD